MYKILLVILAVFLSGCAESYFRLSDESRVPNFFEMPEDESQEQYEVTLTYYSWPDGEAVFELDKKNSWFGGKKVAAETEPNHLIRFADAVDGRPSYRIVRYAGKVDVIEHREKNDIFQMNDNEAVWSKLGLAKP